MLQPDLPEYNVKTRSAKKGKGKVGKGLKAKKSRAIESSPVLSSAETNKPIEPILVEEINTDNEMCYR